MTLATCVKAKAETIKSAEREAYVKIRATWAWISPSGCESSWTSLLWSWEDSSSMTRKRQSCFRLSSSATWAEGLQAFKFPANVSSRRSTAGAVRASNSSTTEAGAYSNKEKKKECQLTCCVLYKNMKPTYSTLFEWHKGGQIKTPFLSLFSYLSLNDVIHHIGIRWQIYKDFQSLNLKHKY